MQVPVQLRATLELSANTFVGMAGQRGADVPMGLPA